MAECVEPMKWSEIKNMTFAEIAKLPCVEIVDEDGEARQEHCVFLMVPTTDFIRAQCDYKGGLSNTNWAPPEVEEAPEDIAPLYVSEKPTKPKIKRKR